MDITNIKDISKEGKTEVPMTPNPDDLQSFYGTDKEGLELQEKLKKISERQVTTEDMLRIMNDTHRILNDEIIALRNELDKKFEISIAEMNKIVSNMEQAKEKMETFDE